MENVAQIIKQLQNTSGSNDKLAILKANKDNELLKKVLYYTYNPFFKYGITESVYDKLKSKMVFTQDFCDNQPTYEFSINQLISVFSMLDKLAQSNINDELRKEVLLTIEKPYMSEDVRNMIKGMLFKDLKIGANSKTINKVWKGLVPLFEVQLAESFGKKTIPTNKEFYVTTKLDGFRILAVPNDNGVYTFYTRKGEVYEGLDHLQEECQLVGLGIYVLDGELIARNDDNLSSGDLYKVTTKIARKKGVTKEKAMLQFHCFDLIDIVEFKQGKGKLPYHERRGLLNSLFNKYSYKLKNLINVEVLYQGNDQSQVPLIANELTEQGYEGAMINLADSYYECKRHAGVLKVKSFKDADVFVKDVYEGTGRNKGRLGGIVIQYLHNGEVQECECGSGFTDKHRQEFWENPSLIVGRIIEVQYFEVTQNDNGGYGLRFPVFKNRFRDDKTQYDITDVANN